MAKLNLAVFKKGKPIVWIIGAVVVFVLFYMLFNRGGASASAGGGTTVVQSGPSEAMQIAGMQTAAAIQSAQIGAGIEAARIQGQNTQAAMAAQIAAAQLASGERVALATLDADREAAAMNVAANIRISENTMNYNLESAKLASETAIGLKEVDAGILRYQLATNAAMFSEQSRNLIATSAIAQIGSLKKKNRDEALTAITASLTGTPNQYVAQGGGGFGFGDIVGVLSPAAAMLH